LSHEASLLELINFVASRLEPKTKDFAIPQWQLIENRSSRTAFRLAFFDDEESRATGDLEESEMQVESGGSQDDRQRKRAAPQAGAISRRGRSGRGELVATRAELKRLQAQLADAQEACWPGGRRILTTIASELTGTRKKLTTESSLRWPASWLPVSTICRARSESERSVEAGESKESGIFLHGVN